MKIWRNKDNTTALKLTSVDFWTYVSAEQVKQQGQFLGGLAEAVLGNESVLQMKVNGAEVVLQGEEADEVYKILKSQKEVL